MEETTWTRPQALDLLDECKRAREAKLGPEWEELFDEQSQSSYFMHLPSGDTQWEMPTHDCRLAARRRADDTGNNATAVAASASSSSGSGSGSDSEADSAPPELVLDTNVVESASDEESEGGDLLTITMRAWLKHKYPDLALPDMNLSGFPKDLLTGASSGGAPFLVTLVLSNNRIESVPEEIKLLRPSIKNAESLSEQADLVAFRAAVSRPFGEA